MQNLFPAQMGGPIALYPSQKAEDRWKEENLALRFADPPPTECADCLHHHNVHEPQRDPDEERLERLLSSFPSKEYRQAEQSRNGGGWWGKPRAERNCKKCSSHHSTNQGLVNLNEEVKRMNEQLASLRTHLAQRTTPEPERRAPGHSRSFSRMAPARSRSSSPEFTTPRSQVVTQT
jgi:hypothetical protein